jgi:phosphoglycolate phosphatase
VEEIVAAYGRRSVEATDVAAFDGVPELVVCLVARDVQHAIATSEAVEVVEPLLARLGMRRWSGVVAGTRIDGLGADKATVVGGALDRLAPIGAAALVGDREHDVRGAHANDIAAIGALWGYGSREELVQAGTDVLADTPANVPRVATLSYGRR